MFAIVTSANVSGRGGPLSYFSETESWHAGAQSQPGVGGRASPRGSETPPHCVRLRVRRRQTSLASSGRSIFLKGCQKRLCCLWWRHLPLQNLLERNHFSVKDARFVVVLLNHRATQI